MSKVYLVSSSSKVRVGKFFSLNEVKLACLSDFHDSKKPFEYYIISVYNTAQNRVTRTHYSRCSYFHFAGCELAQFCLDYGKVYGKL